MTDIEDVGEIHQRRLILSMRAKLVCLTLVYISVAGLTVMLSHEIIASAIAGSAINGSAKPPGQNPQEYSSAILGMGKIVDVDCSPTMDMLAVTTPTFIHLFDPEGTLIRSVGPVADSASRARFSPGGGELVVITNSRLEVWSVQGQKLAARDLKWPNPSGLVIFWNLLEGAFGWSPDGELIAVPVDVQNVFEPRRMNMNCTLLIWDWRGNRDRVAANLTGLVVSLEWLADGTRLVVGEAYWKDSMYFGRVSTYDAGSLGREDGIELGKSVLPVRIQLQQRSEADMVSLTLNAPQVTPLLLYRYEGWIPAFNLTTGHEGAMCSSWSPDSRMVAVGHDDGYLGVWDLSGRKVADFSEPMSIQALHWVDPSILAVESCMGKVTLYDVDSRKTSLGIGPFGGEPIAISWSSATSIYTLWSDINYSRPDWLDCLPTINRVTAWNPQTQEWLNVEPELGGRRVLCLDGSPRGDVLALGTDDALLIVEDGTWQRLYEIRTGSQVWMVEYSADGALLAYVTTEIVVRDGCSMDAILTLPDRPNAIAFSHGDRRLAFGTDKGCTIVDLSTMSCARLDAGSVRALAWAPDGKTIALATTGMGKLNDPEYLPESLEISLWDTNTFRKKAELRWIGKQHRYSSGWVCGPDISLAWSRNSSCLIAATHFGDLLVLNAGLQVIGEPRAFPHSIDAVVPSKTDNTFALGLADGTIRFLDLDETKPSGS